MSVIHTDMWMPYFGYMPDETLEYVTFTASNLNDRPCDFNWHTKGVNDND